MLNIGIVLPEDQQTRLSFHINKNSQYIWQNGQEIIPLQQNTNYIVQQTMQNAIQLFQKEVALSKKTNVATIQNLQPTNLQSEQAIVWDNIIVGRHFHWKKYISQTLPGNFQLKITEQGIQLINNISLENYITCVAISEMGKFCPAAMLQAQMVVARSWFLAHAENKHKEYDACNDDCCQRYQGITNYLPCIEQISEVASGFVLTHNHIICDTRYSKNCGGITEYAHNVWENTSEPYLQSLEDAPKPFSPYHSMEEYIQDVPESYCSPKYVPYHSLQQYLGAVDEQDNYHRWNYTISPRKLTQLLQQKGYPIQGQVIDLQPIQRGNSGRIYELQIHTSTNKIYTIHSEYKIRTALHPSCLFSSAFFVQKTDTHFQLQGAGWGHGVGLCQMGALGMALQGKTFEQILSHYYPNTTLQQMSEICSNK